MRSKTATIEMGCATVGKIVLMGLAFMHFNL